MKKVIWGLALILAVGTFAKISRKSSHLAQATSQKLTLTGSSTVAPLIAEIAKRYEIAHPGVRIEVQTGGSGRGVTDARQKAADIGMVSRDLKDDEKDLTPYRIAKDGIGMIVHRDNPIAALKPEEIVAIYTGKITNWKDVNGTDKGITVVHKAEGRSTSELFLHYFKLKNPEVKASVVIGDNEQGIKTVAGNPDAIGYVSIGAAEGAIKQGSPIKLLPFEGIAATTTNIENGTYPLSRNLNLVVAQSPQGLGAEFIKYAQSKDVSDIIKEQYFVPVTF